MILSKAKNQRHKHYLRETKERLFTQLETLFAYHLKNMNLFIKNIKFVSLISTLILLINVFSGFSPSQENVIFSENHSFVQTTFQNLGNLPTNLNQSIDFQKIVKTHYIIDSNIISVNLNILLKYFIAGKFIKFSKSYNFTHVFIFPFHTFW